MAKHRKKGVMYMLVFIQLLVRRVRTQSLKVKKDGGHMVK